jgi:hypothetical protein
MHTEIRRVSLVVLGFAMCAAAPVGAQEPTGREVMLRYNDQERTRDLSVRQTMIMVNARGGDRRRELEYVTKTDADDNRKLLIRFLEPADVAGTGFLAIEHADREDDNWLYLPALRRTRRIAGADKTDDFMGSEFTYEDLESEKLELHEYTLIGADTIDGIATWVVEAVATDPTKIEESGYGRRELWISQDHHVLIQAKYYDRDGAYVKRFTAGDVRQVPGTGKWRAYGMTMEDVQRGDRTELDVAEYRVDQGVPDSYFSERYLRRGR